MLSVLIAGATSYTPGRQNLADAQSRHCCKHDDSAHRFFGRYN
jgi:hypothetical protein